MAVQVIENLDPWANVWEDVGQKLGEGLMTGYKQGKLAEEMEGMDLNNPESIFNLSNKFLQMGDYDLARKFYELGVTQQYYTGKNLADLFKGQKGSDIGQMSDTTRTSIKNQLKSAFQTTWDFNEINPENLPGGLTEDAAIDEIFAIHQSKNISIPKAIEAFTSEYAEAAGVPRKTETKKAPAYRPE